MKINQQKLLEQLDKIPLGNPANEEKKVKNVRTNINTSKNTHNANCVVLCITICTALIVIASFFTLIKLNSKTQSATFQQPQIVSNIQADFMQDFVKEVALCQNKSPLSIHTELKKLFSYDRYREIDQTTYDKVMAYLKGQNCH